MMTMRRPTMTNSAHKLVAGWIREKAAGLHKQARLNKKNGYTTGPMARFVPRAAAAYMEAANLLEARANELETETDDGGQEQSDKSRVNELVEVASLEWWRLVLADKAKAIIHELEARITTEESARDKALLDISELDERVSVMRDALRLEKERRILTERVSHELARANPMLLLQRDDARRKCLEHLSDADKRKAAFELDWRGLYDGEDPR
jgi:hypothetical protein